MSAAKVRCTAAITKPQQQQGDKCCLGEFISVIKIEQLLFDPLIT